MNDIEPKLDLSYWFTFSSWWVPRINISKEFNANGGGFDHSNDLPDMFKIKGRGDGGCTYSGQGMYHNNSKGLAHLKAGEFPVG